MPAPLTIFAPAKINLYLHVTGKTDGNYHTLDSLVNFADIGDEITIEPASQFSFDINGPYAGYFNADAQKANDKSTNLVVRTVFALAKKFEKLPDFKITLTKNLPLASGMGGGSSNAAATIWGLLEWWNIPTDTDDLPDLFVKLSADVPVCYYSQPARMQGIGEFITPVPDMPELDILLVNPGKPCPTDKVFADVKPPYSNDIIFPAHFKSADQLIEFLAEQRNDLTAPASNIVSEIDEMLALLQKQSGCRLARLSGSGATCFGIFDNAAAAKLAEKTLKKQNPDWWVRAGTLNRIERY
jgi:4-diphosphocytidyl-2-C-methyl-D-erythritol kinase